MPVLPGTLGFGRTAGGVNLPIEVGGDGAIDGSLPGGGEAYATAVRADGATGYWPLAEPSGTTATDYVGAHNGTYSSGVTLGQVGPFPDADQTSAAFDGSASCSTTLAYPTTALSMEVWVYRLGNGQGAKPRVFSDTLATNFPFELSYSDFGDLYFFLDFTVGGATGWVAAATNVISVGSWTHLVVTFDTATSYTIYANGAVVYQTTAYAGKVLLPGQVQWNMASNQGSNSRLAQAATYPTALSATQVARHYALQTAAFNPGIRPLALMYGRTAGDVNVPFRVDASGKLNISW